LSLTPQEHRFLFFIDFLSEVKFWYFYQFFS